MANGIVVYESKYGNTKLVAETIVEGMTQIPGVEIVLSELKEVDLNQTPGLSVRVEGMKGPVAEGELPKCKEFGVTIASRVKS